MTRSKDNNAFEWSNIYLTVNRCFSELDHHHQSRDSGRRVKFSKIAQQKKKKKKKINFTKRWGQGQKNSCTPPYPHHLAPTPCEGSFVLDMVLMKVLNKTKLLSGMKY